MMRGDMANNLVNYNITNSMKWFNEMIEHYALSIVDGYEGSIVNTAVGAIYPFSNENLDETFSIFNPKEKSVLTVGSSGDQVIWALAKGANKVTLIDANPMSLAYTELKLSAIKNLTYEEYIKMFDPNYFLNPIMYAKVSHDLSSQVREFWDFIFSNTSLKYELQNNRNKLFQSVRGMNYRSMNNSSLFMPSEIFNNAKENLGNCEIDFKCAEIQDFARTIDDKYDIMLLSNISDYVRGASVMFPQVFALSNYLTDDGVIELNYDFDKNRKIGFIKAMEFATYCQEPNIMKLVNGKQMSEGCLLVDGGFKRVELAAGSHGDCKERPVITFVTKKYLQERIQYLNPSDLDNISKLLIKTNPICDCDSGEMCI